MEYVPDPYDECFITKSSNIFKTKPPGSISYDSKKKRFRVQGPRPAKKHVGFYNTRTLALEALNYYHISGMKMESDRSIRKQGTGSINGKNGKFIARLSHIYIGVFNTEKDAIDAIITYKITGKKSVYKNKSIKEN